MKNILAGKAKWLVLAVFLVIITMFITDSFDFGKQGQAQQGFYPPTTDFKAAVEKVLDEILANRVLDLNWDNYVNDFTFFESLDGYNKSNVAFNNEDVRFSLPATNNSEALLQKRPSWNAFLTFKVPSYFRTSINTDPSTVANFKGQFVIGTATADGAGGYTTNNKKYGFSISGSNLYGITGNGASESTVLLQTIAISTTYNLTAKFFPGSKVIFYVNGTEKGIITSNLPTFTAATPNNAETTLFTFSIVNNETVAKVLEISYFQYSQQKAKIPN